jgi:hypothetical protein
MCRGKAAKLTTILEMVYDLNYNEDPDYEKIIFAFVKAILEMEKPPCV